MLLVVVAVVSRWSCPKKAAQHVSVAAVAAVAAVSMAWRIR